MPLSTSWSPSFWAFRGSCRSGDPLKTEAYNLYLEAGIRSRSPSVGVIWHVHGGAWTPDDEYIVYTRDFDSGDLFVIDGYE